MSRRFRHGLGKRMPGPRERFVVRQALVGIAKGTSLTLGSRSVVNASALVFGSGLILSIGGFAFHALASRRLGVDSYGALYALISLYGLAGLPVAIFAPVITKYSAEFAALHDDRHMRGLIGLIVRAFGIVGAIYVVAAVALAGPLAAFLHVAAWEIPIVGVMSAVGIVSGTMRSISQGVHAYGAYAVATAGEGVMKVLALALFSIVGLTTFGATGAFLCGMIAGGILIALPLLHRYRGVESAAILLDWRRIFATIVGATVLTLTMTCMGFADVLIVKHFFTGEQAGIYSAASLCGKILLYFVGFVPAVLIPQATHRHARGERTRQILWAAVGFIAVVSILGVCAYNIAGYVVLHALVGNAFNAALPLLPTYAAAMAALAMTSSLASYGISTHRLWFVVPLLLATCATLLTIVFYHPSLATVTSEMMLGNFVMVAAVIVPLALQEIRVARA
jgi:O-antigen/teichoic acid export membrane protein